MFLWELKKLKKLARYARLGKLKDNSFCSQIWAECTPHPKVSSFNFFNFFNFINSRNFNYIN